MSREFQAVKGMPDVLPKDVSAWHQFEAKWLRLMSAYGYEEIRLPILEQTLLFKRSVGEVTDIVEKEMFSFDDREREKGECVNLSLRPEGTAGCIRAALQHGLLYHQTRRLWYSGPMFRHERPQKGRYRQFTQVGIEAFGLEGPDIDLEQIFLMNRFWQMLGISEALRLQVNSLGSLEARLVYREILVNYLSQYEAELDADSQRRLRTNPLRILDSKNPAMAKIIEAAPKCSDHLDPPSQKHFEGFLQGLKDAGIPYEVNPNLVRGLDYYNRTVYEWVTDRLGSQGTVCAGGHYDTLVEQLGGKKEATYGVGFAVGIERVLLVQKELGQNYPFELDAYLINVGEKPKSVALQLAETLRNLCPTLRLVVHCGGGDFKQQFKKADQSGAKIALILGDNEVANGTLGVKFLREEKDQLVVSKAEISKFLAEYLG